MTQTDSPKRPRNLSDLFRGFYQCCWITADFERGIDRMRGFGMDFYRVMETVEVPVLIAGRTDRVRMRVALGTAAGGTREVELIEPLDDPTGVFAAPEEGMRLHHLGISVGDLGQTREALLVHGLDFEIVLPRPTMECAFVDVTGEFGHYLEFVAVRAEGDQVASAVEQG